jgi:outer membrane murein-binding lipoprotein Lpp
VTAFCGKCGAQLSGVDSFCRSCGAPVSDDALTEVGAGYPASTAVMPAAMYEPPPASSSPPTSRPGWVIPAVIGGAVVVIAAVVGAVLLSSGGSSAKPLAEQVRFVVAPVSTDVTELASAQTSAQTKDDLKAVRSAAARLETDAAAASSELATLRVRGSDTTSLALLRSAIGTARDYGKAAAAAASAPTQGNVGAARSAAEGARASFAAISASLPGMSFPPASAFNIDAISSIAANQQETKQRAAQSGASARSYVRTIDQLLTNSSETRANLGDLINGVTNGSITSGEAKSQISGILNQRQSLQNAVASIDPPVGFREASRLLRQSLAAAITDDYAIQGWVDAWNQNDQYTFDQFWNKHLAATSAATRAKQAFVTAYDSARRQVLHIGPLSIGDNY